MSSQIEDYALLSNLRCSALVHVNGSIDWFCAPHFDSPASFAALLGDRRHGAWQIAPAAPFRSQRRYRGDTLVLDTRFEVDGGSVLLTDCMPVGDHADILRHVRCLEGQVELQLRYEPRCGYGAVTPRFSLHDERTLGCVAGPDALGLRSDVPLQIEDGVATASFTLRAGESACFTLAWFASHEPLPPPCDVPAVIAACERWWLDWAAGCRYRGRWREPVMRSLITLKALSFAPTGALIAAPTTSLPEVPGGEWNWDYRYCWLRDAAFMLDAFLRCGYRDEAAAWRGWLLRAVAGHLGDLRPVYNVAGSCDLPEQRADWLPGYLNSRPVRIGNAAAEQRQMDLHGQLIDTMHLARQQGMPASDEMVQLQLDIMQRLDSHWREPDAGIWELRGTPRHYTHSKVMAWVAFDRSIKDAQRHGFDAPIAQWQRARDQIHAEVCAKGVCPRRGCFVQHYGSDKLDASSLLFALVGFLPATDPRIVATVEAIERELTVDGLPYRFSDADKHAAGGEGVFLPCAFWLADNLHLCGRQDEALQLFERLLGLSNDLGLLSECYDPRQRRLLGNFPQSFSHLALINTACHLGNDA